MAALVFGVAGQAVGSFFGPLGAAVGQLVGSAIGNALFPQKVEGPRLTDLKLQSAQYGEFITIFWGTDRFAGKVIWQTDLVEHSETSGGKGGPEVTTYSYTASFAIALCDRYGMPPIVAVPKIWADGRLVHDTTTYTSESNLEFTLYTGTEDQLPDPTIELDKGVGNVPAHRGMAYLVFTDLPMGDFGNRIPNFSFLVTDQAPVDADLHIVKQNDYPLPVQWFEEFGETGVGNPYITQWSPANDGKIVIKNLGGSPSYDYNSLDLTYSGETAYPGPGSAGMVPIATMRMDNPSVIFRTFFYCGQWLNNDVLMHIYVFAGLPISTTGTLNAVLFVDSAYNVDDVNHDATAEVAFSSGIPDGAYIRGVAFSQDKRSMFVFTSPTSSPVSIDTWYELRDGAVVRDGTVNPPITSHFVYGNSAGSYALSYRAGQFENNGRWMWHMSGAGDVNSVTTYFIDDDGNFAERTDLGAAGGNDLSPETSEAFTSVSIEVIAPGYVGVVTYDALAVISRFPTYDPTGWPLDEVVTDLCVRSGLDEAEVNATSLEDDLVSGYKLAQQGTARAALGPLQNAYMFDAVESDTTMKFVKRGSDSIITIPDDDLAVTVYGSDHPDALSVTRVPEEELPQQVNVDFTNIEDDYQQGHAYDRREVTLSDMEQTIACPIAMLPKEARHIAQLLLYNQWIERERFSFTVPRKYAYLEPTDVVTVKGRRMRLTKQDQSQDGVIRFEGVAAATRSWIPAAAGVSGLGFTPTEVPNKQLTDLAPLDLPLTSSSQAQPGFQVAVAGRDSTSWRGAGIFKSTDGVTYTQLDQELLPDIIGSVPEAVPDFTGGNVFDETTQISVTLSKGSAELESKTATEVLNGANECAIGPEVMNFKTATLTADRTYTLSGLLRGRYGTEWAMSQHITNERFVMLPAKDYEMSAAELNADRYYKAVSLGNTIASADTVLFRNTGVRVKPLSPVLVGGGLDASGNLTINWTRRSRIPAAWQAPLGEDSESYVVQIWNSAYTLVARSVSGITSPTFQYTAAMAVADFGAVQQNYYVTVAQVGTYLYGYEARATLPGSGGSNNNPPSPVAPYSPPPVSGGSVSDNHFANFESLFYGDEREHLLAWKYTRIGNVIAWYQQNQFEIIDRYFRDYNSYANWVQAADIMGPITLAENAMLQTLANSAEA